MIRNKQHQSLETITNMRGGQGEISLRSLLAGPDEMNGKGRLYKLITIPVGASIGYHVHEGESETFYIVRGSGIFDDNGTPMPFTVGDVLHTLPGHGHGVRNTGEEPVEMVALILYADEDRAL